MEKNIEWRKEHFKTIKAFIEYLNEKSSDFILKGGTSLMLCYNLNRFSEDIDLDGRQNAKSLENIVEGFCEKNGYDYRVAKDTEVVKRFMVYYGGKEKPLKVECSFRQKNIPENIIKKINGITVYDINTLCQMKSIAYQSRDRIRDLFDVCFICNNYWDKLSVETQAGLRNAIMYKGIEQFDYIVQTQPDELIDNDKLAENFLKMYDKLGLLCTEEEKQIIAEHLPKEEAKKEVLSYEQAVAAYNSSNPSRKNNAAAKNNINLD